MKKQKMLTPTSVRLDADLKAALEDLAAADDRSLSRYIIRILRAHVEATRKGKR